MANRALITVRASLNTGAGGTGPLDVLENARVRFFKFGTYNKNTDTGTPISATLYSDPVLNTPVVSNPAFSDVNGLVLAWTNYTDTDGLGYMDVVIDYNGGAAKINGIPVAQFTPIYQPTNVIPAGSDMSPPSAPVAAYTNVLTVLNANSYLLATPSGTTGYNNFVDAYVAALNAGGATVINNPTLIAIPVAKSAHPAAGGWNNATVWGLGEGVTVFQMTAAFPVNGVAFDCAAATDGAAVSTADPQGSAGTLNFAIRNCTIDCADSGGTLRADIGLRMKANGAGNTVNQDNVVEDVLILNAKVVGARFTAEGNTGGKLRSRNLHVVCPTSVASRGVDILTGDFWMSGTDVNSATDVACYWGNLPNGNAPSNIRVFDSHFQQSGIFVTGGKSPLQATSDAGPCGTFIDAGIADCWMDLIYQDGFRSGTSLYIRSPAGKNIRNLEIGRFFSNGANMTTQPDNTYYPIVLDASANGTNSLGPISFRNWTGTCGTNSIRFAGICKLITASTTNTGIAADVTFDEFRCNGAFGYNLYTIVGLQNGATVGQKVPWFRKGQVSNVLTNTTYQSFNIPDRSKHGTGELGIWILDGVTAVSGASLAGSTYTATQDLDLIHLQGAAGVNLNMDGYRLRVQNECQPGASGTFVLHNNGNNATGSGNNAGAATSANRPWGQGGAGGAGGTGANGNGAVGTAGMARPGAAGGAAGTGTGTPGAAAVQVAPSTTVGGPGAFRNPLLVHLAALTGGATLVGVTGGSGGSGGAADAAGNAGGAGGGGAGPLGISAGAVVGSGGGGATFGSMVLRSKGGDASNAAGGNAGGGSPGAPGPIFVHSGGHVIGLANSNVTIDTSPGLVGNGSGSGNNGNIPALGTTISELVSA